MVKFKKTALLAVQGPVQFITAYIAMRWYEEQYLKEKVNATLLIYDTFVPLESELGFFESIKNLAAIQDWKDMIFIGSKQMRKISFNSYNTCIKTLKERLKNDEFDVVFFSGDFGNFGTSLLLSSYPSAYHIEFGDSFGLVGNMLDVRDRPFNRFKSNPLGFSKALLKKIVFRHFHSKHNLQKAILPIPIDWTGSYLTGQDLDVPNLNFVKQILKKLSDQIPQLKAYCKEILGDGSNDLYLLSNFSNSGFSTLENEINLYEEIVRENSNLNSTVILKNHPRGSNMVVNNLYDRLKKDFCKVKIIDNSRFSFLPIELWSYLIEMSNVYPVFSSSVISIKCLLSKDVIMVLDERKIERYIHPSKVDETMKSEDMCESVLTALYSWDGKSVLWSGKSTS